jgi:hypothetical protein
MFSPRYPVRWVCKLLQHEGKLIALSVPAKYLEWKELLAREVREQEVRCNHWLWSLNIRGDCNDLSPESRFKWRLGHLFTAPALFSRCLNFPESKPVVSRIGDCGAYFAGVSTFYSICAYSGDHVIVRHPGLHAKVVPIQSWNK